MIRIAMLALGALTAGAAWSAEQQLETGERGTSAQARPTYSLEAQPRINRLDFVFGPSDATAWINAGGDFYIQGGVQHRGLMCATYRMGMRFGIGAPGCLNVEWISDPIFVTSQYQCNGARVEHSGGDAAPEMGEQIVKITCAERVIRCSGSCR